ncbi:unnamed protein product [Rotaria sordida]|uniref:ABCA1-4-like C-terminal R2 regulatory domain-containing protein n=1 Tax=Rotaria sordida TaxID=392033 RepID=A0A819JF18_9BILA|nr:unnamed protein product [Rotaria sordida]
MKMGQFMCLGNLQHLRNRFGNGYAIKVKVVGDNVDNIKTQLMSDLPGIEIQDQHNEVLFCNVPFSHSSTDGRNSTQLPYNLAHVFEILNKKKEQKIIESYSVTQTTLEQIFVQLAGEDEDILSDQKDNKNKQSKKFYLFYSFENNIIYIIIVVVFCYNNNFKFFFLFLAIPPMTTRL